MANLVAFVSSTAASTLLGHVVPATLSALAVLCWLVLARRTWLAEPERRRRGQASKSTDTSSLTG